MAAAYVARLVNMTPDAQNCRVECMLSGAMLRRLTADERELGDEPGAGRSGVGATALAVCDGGHRGARVSRARGFVTMGNKEGYL